ncbi:DUF4258 domain-containing protein [Larkinella soli]
MECKFVTYRFHAIQQMFTREISRLEVEQVLANGEIIEADFKTRKKS